MTADSPGLDVQAAVDGELRLLTRATRSAALDVEALLDPSFVEFGASGRRWDRRETLEMLAQEDPADDSLIACDVRGTRLADGVVLVTYISVHGERRCNRSSIWRRTADGWRLFFHQGTLIPPTDAT